MDAIGFLNGVRKRRPIKRRVTEPFETEAEAVEAGPYPWVVYVLTDAPRQRYSISMAKDAGARALRHRVCQNLKQVTPFLVLTEPYADRHTAVARMQRLRLWSGDALRELIEASNPEWQDLA